MALWGHVLAPEGCRMESKALIMGRYSKRLERLEPGGLIIGRRCSTSQNIGAKARKASQ